MADIVPSLFGIDPSQIQAQQDAQAQNEAYKIAQLDPSRALLTYGMMNGARNVGNAINSTFGLKTDSQLHMEQTNAALKDIQDNMSPEDLADPTKMLTAIVQHPNVPPDVKQHAYDQLQQTRLDNAKIANENAQATNWLNKNKQDSKNNQSEIDYRDEVKQATIDKGEPLTQEELVQIAAKYATSDKVLTTQQTSLDKAAYREQMAQQIQDAGDQRIELARQKGASAMELEKMKADIALQVAGIKATALLGTKANPKIGAYMKIYNGSMVTSGNELALSSKNLGLMTNGGAKGLTAGAFVNVGSGGILSATGKALTTTITPVESQQYESIMLPVLRNIGTLQNMGRPPTQAQLDILQKALIATPGQPYIAQIQKMGEIRQIFEAAIEGKLADPEFPDDHKEQLLKARDAVAKGIPFTGTDVIEYAQATQNQPNLTLKQFLASRDTPKETTVSNAPILTDKAKIGLAPIPNKKLVEFSTEKGFNPTGKQLREMDKAMQAVALGTLSKDKARAMLLSLGIKVQ